MAEGRIDSVIDLQKVQSEIDVTSKGIADLVAQINAVKNTSLNITGAKSVSEFNTLNKELHQYIELTNKAAQSAISQSTATKSVASAVQQENLSLQENIQLRKRLQTSLQSYIASQKEDLALLKAGTITRAEYNQRTSEAAVKIEQYKGRIRDLDSQIKQQTKTERQLSIERIKNQRIEEAANRKQVQILQASIDKINKQSGAYALLSKQYNEVKLAAQNFNAQLGANNPLTIAATRNALELSNRLKEIDASVGVTNRNVGNYTKGIAGYFGKTFGYLRTLANIIPGLGISGLLLLIVDQFANLGKLITGTERSMQKATESAKLLGKAFEDSEYKQAISNVSELKINIDLARKGFLDKKDVLKQYNDTLGETLGEVSNLDEAEKLLVKNGPAYIQMTLFKSAANLALNEAAALSVELAKDQLDPNARSLAVTLRRTEAEQKYGKEIRQSVKYQELLLAANNAFNKSLEDRSKANDDAAKAAANARDVFFEEQLELKSGGVKAKNQKTLIDIANDFQKKAAELSSKFNIDFFGFKDKDKKDDTDKLLANKLKAQFEAARIEAERLAEFAKEIADNENKSLLDRLKALKQYTFLKQEIILLNYAEERSAAKGNADALLLADAKRKDAEIRLARETEKEIEKIRFSERTKLAEKATADELAVYDKFYNDLTDRVKQYEKEKDRLDKERKDKDKKNAEERKRLEQQLVSELTTLAFTVFTAGIEREKNAIQEQIDLLEQKKQKDIEVANATIANTEERAAAIQIIEARAAAQKEQLVQKQRQLDIRKAQFDKAQSIARIIQETAQGVIKFTASGNPVLAALVAAIGAAQLATVFAQPIPRYKGGTENHKGGLAIVGDGKKSEGITLPDGTVLKSPATDTLMNLPAGTKVHPDYDKMILSATMTKVPTFSAKSTTDTSTPKILTGLSKVEKAIKKIPQPITSVENVLSRKIRKGGSVTNRV